MIEFQNVTIEYPDGTKAIRDFSCTINDEECVALVGANGAGKSTLLLSLVGVTAPVQGTILIDGAPVEKTSLAEIRKHVGMVFQNPDDQLFMPTLFDDVAFGPRNWGHSEEEVAARVEETLNSLGILRLRDKMPQRLSGGEKRMAALATVLVMRPRVLLLDEPSSFLDPKARRSMISALGGLSLTKLVATHDMDLAFEICDRVMILKQGELFAQGAPSILRDEALMDACGLEPPLCCCHGTHIL